MKRAVALACQLATSLFLAQAAIGSGLLGFSSSSALAQTPVFLLAQPQHPVLASAEPELSQAQSGMVDSLGTCTVQPSYPLATDAAVLKKLLVELDASSLACLRSPVFHAWRGAVLLALRQSAAAAEALERALLLDPDQPGAQLDYAQVLFSLGDTASARDLLGQIASRADVPLALRPLLARELAAFNALQAWRNRWILTSAWGRDSNLNNAPTAAELTLTFDQINVTLPLGFESRPQSGAALLGIVQWQGLKPQGRHLWALQAEVRARRTAQAATSYQQADLSASWLEAPEARAQWIVRGGVSRIDFGGQTLLHSARLSLLRQWQPAPLAWAASASLTCRPSIGVEYEPKRFPGTPNQNANYGGGVVSVNCSASHSGSSAAVPGRPGAVAGTAFWPDQLGFQLRAGTEQAMHASRPGGDQRRLEWRTTWESRLGSYKTSADYSYTRQSDSTGYSPLLDNNAIRFIRRHSLRLEVSDALLQTQGVDWFASFEFNMQRSNLQAFANRQNVVYAGLRWSLQ